MNMKKNTAILGGLVAAFFLVRALRKNSESAVMEQKLHDLQDKFKSLDAEPAPV